MHYKFQRVYIVEKSLSERLAKKELTKEKTKGTKNKVVFLTLRSDINEAITAGWAIKAIWGILSEEGKVNFSYKTFRTYVSRLIFEEGLAQKNNVNSSDTNLSKKQTRNKVAAIPTFTFQSKPNPEELL
ncbi:TraK family protein [Legionella sp.]|uniref:TraK family protein n=1 Tax=Legionella sp. TaxID=459 RepID=UPI000CA8F797|nr:TraK family protein [Legionella sp.]PJE14239.1 MAG: conjugal transfer protein TraK [Legionella sp.]